MLRRVSPVPASVDKKIVQPESQEGELVPLKIVRIYGTHVHGSSDPRHDSDLVRIDHGPAGSEAGMPLALQQPHPGHDEKVVRPGVAELMPPVLADDLALVDLVDSPEVAVAVLVQEDGLEDVFLERHVGRELRLVVRAVEAHLQLRHVRRVRPDEIHSFEVVFAEVASFGMVDAVDLPYSEALIVEVLVMTLHVVDVLVGDGDVVRELGRAENLRLESRDGRLE